MGNRPDSFMPFYIGDYLADTSHLSVAEHGAYLLLIFHYWRIGGPLADAEDTLMRITRTTKREWGTVHLAVRAFFKETTIDGRPFLTHPRIEKELLKATDKYEKRRDASAKGNAIRWGSQSDGQSESQNDPNASPIAVPMRSQPQPQPHSPTGEKKQSLGFDEFWSTYPRRVAKGAAEKAYRSALGRSKPEVILAGAKAYAESRRGEDQKFTKHPATWLGQSCWEDDAPAKGNGAADAPLSEDDALRLMVRMFKEHGVWPLYEGPEPGQPFSRLPAWVLKEFGYEVEAQPDLLRPAAAQTGASH